MSKTVFYTCDKCGRKMTDFNGEQSAHRIEFSAFPDTAWSGCDKTADFSKKFHRDFCQPCIDDLKHWIEYDADGYHTFKELYEYRRIYHAWACRAWVQAGYPVVKSKRHYYGEKCFGGGWFIVSAELPTGQVTNHYELDFWDLFDVPEVDRAPEWDRHSTQMAAERVRDALTMTGKNDD